MDNGRNRTDRTMLGSGEQAAPVRLWWARHDGDSARSVEISGLPYGTESNPPAWDPKERIVVAYDAGNAVLRAWRLIGDDLALLWRRDGFAHAGHLILYPDTRELVAQDWRDTGGPAPAARSARCGLPSRCWRNPPPRAAPRWPPAAINSSCSMSTAATRRPGLPCPPHHRASVPRAGLRTRRLLPVAHHDRPGGGRLAAITRVMAPSPYPMPFARLGAQSSTSG